MKIIGVSRSRIKAEIEKIKKVREKAVFHDQCVLLPISVDTSNVLEPEEEEIKSFEEEFKTLPGYREELFYPVLAVNVSAGIFMLSNLFTDPLEALTKEYDDKMVDEGILTAAFYIDKMSLFGQADLDKNPYLKKIKIEEGFCDGLIHMENKKYDKYHICISSDYTENGYDYSHGIAVATEDIIVPAILLKDTAMERVCQNEILLTQDAIDRAHGRVAAFDTTRMQYFTYMAHLKSDVESVTIVGNIESLQIFKDFILPQFDYPEKIRFKEEDCNRIEDAACDYDFAFMKMWDEFRIGIKRYHGLLKFQAKHPETECVFYMENAMLEHIKNVLISDIILQSGLPVKFGVQPDNDEIDYILDVYKEIVVLTPEALKKTLSSAGIKKYLQNN